MFIVPIQPISGLEGLQQIGRVKPAQDESENPFKSLVMDAIGNVQESGTSMNNEIQKLATGQTDNIAEPLAATMKYTTSVELMVQIRNKALDAYNEIMRMGV